MDIYKKFDRNQLKTKTLQMWFSGILNQIYRASDKKYNISEIIFSYKTICRRDVDPEYVLDYEKNSRYGTGPSCEDQFFCVYFKRIKVMPVAYAFISDFYNRLTNHLISWAFQGQNAEGEWVTLDESHAEDSLKEPGSLFLGHVRADQFYTNFRILQTGPSHSGFFSFNLTAFEIHVLVQPRF